MSVFGCSILKSLTQGDAVQDLVLRVLVPCYLKIHQKDTQIHQTQKSIRRVFTCNF